MWLIEWLTQLHASQPLVISCKLLILSIYLPLLLESEGLLFYLQSSPLARILSQSNPMTFSYPSYHIFCCSALPTPEDVLYIFAAWCLALAMSHASRPSSFLAFSYYVFWRKTTFNADSYLYQHSLFIATDLLRIHKIQLSFIFHLFMIFWSIIFELFAYSNAPVIRHRALNIHMVSCEHNGDPSVYLSVGNLLTKWATVSFSQWKC